MEFDEDDDEEYEVPWVLIPITGVSVCSVRHLYTKTDRVHFTIIKKKQTISSLTAHLYTVDFNMKSKLKSE